MNGTTDVINTENMTGIHQQTTDLINQLGHVPINYNKQWWAPRREHPLSQRATFLHLWGLQ